MSHSFITFALICSAACWVFVIGHQLDWQVIDPARYPFMLLLGYLAYPIAFMSVSVVGAALLLAVFKK